MVVAAVPITDPGDGFGPKISQDHAPLHQGGKLTALLEYAVNVRRHGALIRIAGSVFAKGRRQDAPAAGATRQETALKEIR